MSTASWTGVELIIRNHLLTFVPIGGGAILRTRIGVTASGSGSDGKLFLDQAPDDVSGFWGTLRTLDAPPQGSDGGTLIRATAELNLYGRPRSVAAQVKAMAALCYEAWFKFSYTEVGGHISAMKINTSGMVPAFAPPADRELVNWRMLLPFRCSPIFLTRYAA